MIRYNGLIILVILLLVACKKSDQSTTPRYFLMGSTPWPADFTDQDVDRAYQFINDHCDIVSHHFDEGIPYEEAYKGLSFAPPMIEDINRRKTKTAPGKTILLEVAPLDLSRKKRAVYSSLVSIKNDSIENYWEQLSFNDPKIIDSYTNFVSRLVEELNPTFVNYAVESNESDWNAAEFLLYEDFLSKVYSRLKTKYPAIPFFVSLMVSEEPSSLQYAQELLRYSDYVALSAYPYIIASSTANGDTDPKLLPPDYFTRFINLAPDKPFAFAETGYIAEDLTVPSFNLAKFGKAEWQRDYLDLVCKLCNEKKAKFMIWFAHQDYDAGVSRLKQLGLYMDLFALWEDTGLIDENNVQRPAYQLWKDWMNKRKQ